jgi:hypothetical protein
MFDYIYSDSKRKFSFIKLPSVLFTDEQFNDLTNDMKLLYALMLDRASLSVKNGWVDSSGRVYINFPLAEIEEKLHVASQKASRLLKALERAGLIERVRQGLGKPDRIYVKDCSKCVAEEEILTEKTAETMQVQPCVEIVESSEVSVVSGDDSEPPIDEKSQPMQMKNTVQSCEKTQVTQYNNQNNKTILKQSDPISQIAGRMDGMEQRKTYEQLIKANIEYDWFRDVFALPSNEPQRPKGTIEELDDIVAIMVDCICTRAKTIRVGCQDMDADVVRSQLLKLNNEHIQYVFERVYNYAGEIANIRAYMITVLYNAPLTMNTAFGMSFRASFGV